ncbi:MAG TPA: molybdate ABC transporter substrate-binding protein, partial [Sphingomonadaceae bacterium]|nr:molybdate ABC transporter substrate-binding protein [Sphingomonadaceae bacterium]
MRWFPSILAAALLLLGGCSREPDGPVVFAPASLQGALDEVAEAWAVRMRDPPVISYAASSALARQVEGGAPADIFISADGAWMDELEAAGLLRPATRTDLLGNALVLIQPGDVRRSGEFRLDQASWEREIAGKWLALAEPEAVPAGRYARAALERLGLWEAAG